MTTMYDRDEARTAERFGASTEVYARNFNVSGTPGRTKYAENVKAAERIAGGNRPGDLLGLLDNAYRARAGTAQAEARNAGWKGDNSSFRWFLS